MKRYLLIMTMLQISSFSFSQNLVPNPSFELHDTCPDHLSQISRAKYWIGLNNTPDYYNICGSSPFKIPDSYAGYQATPSNCDSGYAGLFSSTINELSNEVIGTTLLHPLTTGKKYFVSFQVNATYYENAVEHLICFTNRFGFKFLTYSPSASQGSQFLINNQSDYSEDSILRDTLNWKKVFTNFVADSAYEFIALGNFYTKPNYIFDCPGGQLKYSYLYIDNVCVSEDSSFCDSFTNQCSHDTVRNLTCFFYPNPATTYINVQLGDGFIEEPIMIFNALGQLVQMFTSYNNELIIDCSKWTRGIYMIKFCDTTKILILI